jgi:hypothetical protein
VTIGHKPILLEETVTQPATVDQPVITSLTPSSTTAGGPTFTLTIKGSGFLYGAIVYWNGSGRYRTFVSSTEMTARILWSDILKAGTAQVSVMNPAPGETKVYSGCKCVGSSTFTFTVNP